VSGGSQCEKEVLGRGEEAMGRAVSLWRLVSAVRKL
jgi:hypothetical protein